MRVLIINTAERIGGAAIAANRLMEALKNNGIKAKMLVRNKQTDQVTVVALNLAVHMGTNCHLGSQRLQPALPFCGGYCQHGYRYYLLTGVPSGRCDSPALD